ncbi:branched-chain amino acid ABC transporter permease [Candidatus Deferrimicrobium sp.]|uniref:branched-chain amino acid ABC transporter permease n=1 Tax=Candidatus Deferrimicrobium sp. TaxID=3060586 RepID=UPI0027215656|nr:branched-chain amino acid ABC transporter permease [Candidatus Deferrimicrobium sp.]MDO8739470.1 branched-chain amino acid ABC transporter permease [Candidatus Deferrimicrobium sp.]MDP2658744.1 branched-chain amino acid ABC transporter permease [Candidatus Deferrimicrobium sp.]
MASNLAVAVLNGIVWGLIMALIALGLNLIFGLLHIINMAHGALYMLGAVFAWYVIELTGNYWLALFAAPLAVGLIGLALERGLLRTIEDQPLVTIICTFGIMLVLQQLVLTYFGGTARRIALPIPGRIPLFDLQYPVMRIVIAAISAAVMGGLWFFLNRTRYGLWMRAVVQDREMAVALGIPVHKVYMWTFVLGSVLAAFSGVLAAPIVSVDFMMGREILIMAFIIVIVGGMGNLWGSVVTAVVISLIHGVGSIFVVPSTATVFSLGFMIVVLLFRPQGLFGE